MCNGSARRLEVEVEVEVEESRRQPPAAPVGSGGDAVHGDAVHSDVAAEGFRLTPRPLWRPRAWRPGVPSGSATSSRSPRSTGVS